MADSGVMYDELIPALTTAVRIACSQLTATHRQVIRAHVEQSVQLSRKPGWERKATAHAQLYPLLADGIDDPEAAEHEAESYLRCLHYTAHLALTPRGSMPRWRHLVAPTWHRPHVEWRQRAIDPQEDGLEGVEMFKET
jgi:hypothetical protein